MVLPPRRSRAGRVPAERAAALDEMWSFVGAKEKARWLWHALDHHTGRVLAYVVGTRKDAVFLKLKALLTPFGITRYGNVSIWYLLLFISPGRIPHGSYITQ